MSRKPDWTASEFETLLTRRAAPSVPHLHRLLAARAHIGQTWHWRSIGQRANSLCERRRARLG